MGYVNNDQFPVEDAVLRLDIVSVTADYSIDADTDNGKTFVSGDGGVNKTITLPESPAVGFQVLVVNGFQGRTLTIDTSGSDIMCSPAIIPLSDVSTGVAGFSAYIRHIGAGVWSLNAYGIWTLV